MGTARTSHFRRARARRSKGATAPPVAVAEWGEARAAPADYDPGAPTGPLKVAQVGPGPATRGNGPNGGQDGCGGQDGLDEAPTAEMGYPRGVAPPERRVAEMSGEGTELPHWADPPTGEVPSALAHPDDELEAWRLLGSRGLHWREDVSDWSNGPGVEDLVHEEDEPVTPPPPNRGGPYSFDEDFERLERERSGATFGGRPQPQLVEDDEEGPMLGEADFAPRALPEAPPSEEAPAGHETAALEPPRPGRGWGRGPQGRPAAARSGARRGEAARRVGPYDVGERAYGRPSGRDVGAAVATGAVLVALFIVCYLVGPAALLALSALALLGCALEAFSMFQRAGFRPATLVAVVGSVGAVLAAYWRGSGAIVVVAAVVLVAALVWYLAQVVEARPLINAAVTFLGFAWVGLLGSFAGLLLAAQRGEHLFLGAVVPTVAADVAAWFAGSTFGQHHLAPRTSPGKTWEGVVAGGLVAIAAAAIIGKEVAPWGGLRHGLILGVLIAVAAPLGDLAQSMVKRDLRLKDSGALLPGHGGLLDRFDSLLFALPVTYYVATVFHLVK
jgi:phosphatidate cytidylyltransferase